MFWRNEKTASLDYIMPESVQKGGVALEIPGTYAHLISAYPYLRFIQKDDKQELSMPPLNVIISYHDISGRSSSLLQSASSSFCIFCNDVRSIHCVRKSSSVTAPRRLNAAPCPTLQRPEFSISARLRRFFVDHR